MNGLYDFLCWLNDTGADQKNIFAYKNRTGKMYYDFCVEYNLIETVRKNSWGDDVYALNQRGKELLASENFRKHLNRLEKGEI